MIHKAKADYFRDKLSSADQSAAFKTVKSLLKPNATKQLPTTSSDQQLANDFADFFSDKVEKIRTSLAAMQKDLEAQTPGKPLSCELSEFRLVSAGDVKSIIKQSPTKSCSLDSIPTWLLKDSVILDVLLPWVTAYINASLKSATVPECHKLAIITPLLKKGARRIITRLAICLSSARSWRKLWPNNLLLICHKTS